MPVPLTDEARAYMCRAYLIRSVDQDAARHWESEARHYGATPEQIADAWHTRRVLNAPHILHTSEGAA